MKLVIDKFQRYNADHVCTSAQEGQRILNEYPVTVLYLGQILNGRGTALDVLKWAKQKNRLPLQVMLTSNKPEQRKLLAEYLLSTGYVGDGIFFHKTLH